MDNRTRNLILFTSHFPYGLKESFIEIEFPYLKKNFSRIAIITNNVSDQGKRPVGDDVSIYRISTRATVSSLFSTIFILVKGIKTIFRFYREELLFRKSIAQNLSKRQKRFVLKRIVKALEIAHFTRGLLLKEDFGPETLLYSYWFYTNAHAISMIDTPGVKKIARAHGTDLYAHQQMEGILPLQYSMSKRMDGIFFISENGKQYFKTHTSSGAQNLYVSRLGITPDKSTHRIKASDDGFTILSCSNVVAVKRLHLIIESLKAIKEEIKIHWIHFGDGPLMDEIKKMASQKLNPRIHITYSLNGRISNENLHKYYSTHKVDLFLNVSESEGVPVSIMEAQAYGIPCIATDVGGTSEVVVEGTGMLLPKNFSNEELGNAITRFTRLSQDEYAVYQKNCIANWNERYNAETNFKEFIRTIEKFVFKDA